MALHPTSVKNSFLSHLVFWAIFLPTLSTVFMPLLIPDQNISRDEVAMVRDLGVDIDDLTAETNKTFSDMFISNGMMSNTEQFFSAGENARFHTFESGWAAKWIRGVWLMIYKAIWRMKALWLIFFLPAVALCIPAAFDGIMARAKKKYEFGSFNPVAFYSSTHLISFIIGMFVFLPLTPIALSTVILTLMLLGIAAAVWVAASNLQAGGN